MKKTTVKRHERRTQSGDTTTVRKHTRSVSGVAPKIFNPQRTAIEPKWFVWDESTTRRVWKHADDREKEIELRKTNGGWTVTTYYGTRSLKSRTNLPLKDAQLVVREFMKEGL